MTTTPPPTRLERSDMAAIVGIQLRHLADRLAARRLTLDVSPEAELWLAERAYDPDFGARPLKRVIQKEVGDKLALALLEGHYTEGGTVKVDVAAGQLVLV